MINLLPDERKRDIQAARMNVVLLRYNLLFLSALGFLIIVCLLFYVILQSSQSNAVNTSNDNSSKAASYAEVRTSADEYRNNLSIASKILDSSVNYTAVVFAITELLPDGVVLDNVNIDASHFGKQTTFSAHAKTYAKATELKERFQKAESLFSNVYFENLTDNGVASGSQTPPGYPIAVTISAKLAQEFK